jgi:predicted transposase
MKTIVKIKLLTDEIGKKRLLDTMEAFNQACDYIAITCFEQQSASKFKIQKLVYHDVREKFGLSAQLTIRAIAKTCDAYKLNKKVKCEFKKHGSITYTVLASPATPATGSLTCTDPIGGERDGSLGLGMIAFRMNGNEILIDVNVAGIIRTRSLGSAS